MIPAITSFSNDSGLVGDNRTNDSTLVLTGKADAGASVKIYDGSALIGTAVANASGFWSYTTGALSNGSHSFTAAALDLQPVGFPDASTTGVSSGVKLTSSGSITVKTTGAVISGLDIRGEVVILAPDVTLRDCRITATSFWAISIFAPNVKIENCEIVSDYASGGTKGIYVDDYATGAIIRNNDISDVEDGIYVSTSNVLIEGNYIHDLDSAGPDPHYDGVQLYGGIAKDVIIRNNTIIVDDTDNSAITMGVVQNVAVTGNFLSGGGYTIYVDGRNGTGTVSNVSILNNVLGSHNFGYFSFERSDPVHTGNTTEAGTAIDPSGAVKAAAASDSAAAAAVSSPLVVTIDTIAPSAPTLLASTPDAVLASTRIEVLTGTAEANSTVAVFDGATRLGTAVAGSNGGWSYTTAVLAPGVHNFSAVATDLAGNTGSASAVSRVNVPSSAPPSTNLAPIEIPQTVWVEAGSSQKLLRLAALADPEGAALSYRVTMLPAEGALLDGNGAAIGLNQVLTQAQFQSLTYSSPQAAGSRHLTFDVSDGVNHTTHTVTLNVTAPANGILIGTSRADRLDGAAGNDVLNGGAGADFMIGGTGNDTYIVDNFRDVVDERGGNGRDLVKSAVSFNLGSATALGAVEDLILTAGAISGSGNSLDNVILGNGAANILRGYGGDDTLNGYGGNDVLYGGSGNDVLIFNTLPDAVSNIDAIADFGNAPGNDDSIHLENALFVKLGIAGPLNAAFFRAGSAAVDANDYVVYNKASGALYYDVNGNAPGGAYQFATLLTKPTLSAADFVVV